MIDQAGIGDFSVGYSAIGGTTPFPWITTVLSQYANSPTIMQLISNLNTYIDPATNIDSFFQLIWNVYTAQGYGLDVWGRIVGVSRILEVASVDYFGMENPTGTAASGLPLNQAPFFHGQPLTSNYALLDGPFLVLILAKAAFNICDGSIPAINQILMILFGSDGPLPVAGGAWCTDGNDMTMTYTFGSALDAVQTAIVLSSGVLPRPCGVSSSVVQL